MQIAAHARGQRVEPCGAVAGLEVAFERARVGWVVDDGGDEARRRGGEEDAENRGGGEGRGERVGDGSELEEDGGVSGERCYAC